MRNSGTTLRPVGDRTARRTATATVGVVASAMVLWAVLAWAFANDRGIGFQDEGLYLLAADPPSPTAGWVTPFGWHTAPFFELVGHDIGRFRTLGLWLLVLAGALLGHTVARRIVGDADDRAPRATRVGTAAIGALGAPLLTSGFLRTPGYNWVNLLGLMLATTGAVLASTVSTGTTSLWRSRRLHVALALLTLGVWFTVPAKPSSAPLFLLAATAFLAPQFRRRTGTVALMTVAWSAAWTTFGLLLGWWPSNFLEVLQRSADFPPLDRNQTLPGAFRDVLRTPKVAWQYLTDLRPATLALVAVAAVLAAVASRRQGPHAVLRMAPLTLVCVAAVGTAAPWPLLGLPEPFVRFDWYGTTNAGLLLFVGALLHLLANRDAVDRVALRAALAITGLSAVAVVAFGFGSAMGIYPQAALASTLVWCAAAAVASAAGGSRRRASTMAVLVLAGAALLATNIVASRQQPFDGTTLLAPIGQQTEPAVIGPHDATVMVDAGTHQVLDELRNSATASGFCPGTPLIGLVWQWTSTTAYAVRAEVPEHLILTIFGYPAAADVLDVTMQDLEVPKWRDAWVATTDPTALEAADAAALREALDRLPGSVGRAFPDDYVLGFTVDDLQFWRPLGAPEGVCD